LSIDLGTQKRPGVPEQHNNVHNSVLLPEEAVEAASKKCHEMSSIFYVWSFVCELINVLVHRWMLLTML